ncbi:phosphotransferase [Klebsiella variicola subsp. variicola]|nr:phosphotransferase [Klebsiella variicola subsp. variicola]
MRLATLSEFLEGELLANVPSTALQMKNIGQILAEMDVALKGFDHKGAHRLLAWDVAQAASCRSMLPEKGTTDNESRWDLVRNRLDCFVIEIQPRLRDLRQQVLHADFNPYNILMDVNDFQKVSGILDLGDMVYTQLINNVAIAATYQVNSQDPLNTVIELVTAYHDVLPLKSEEIDLLYDLIIIRLCMAVTITEFRARQYPENSKYILKNTATAWRGLERLSTISREEASVVFRMACNFPSRR